MLPPIGSRVRMTGIMPNDPDPLEIGAEGTVTGLTEAMYGFPAQIYVEWDNGRTLILLSSDPFEVVRKERK